MYNLYVKYKLCMYNLYMVGIVYIVLNTCNTTYVLHMYLENTSYIKLDLHIENCINK